MLLPRPRSTTAAPACFMYETLERDEVLRSIEPHPSPIRVGPGVTVGF